MEVNKKYIYFVVFIVLALLIALGISVWVKPTRALNLVVPRLEQLQKIKAAIHSDTVFMDVKAVLENKAPYKIGVDSLSYNLKLAGRGFVSENQILNLSLAPSEKDTVDLTFRLPMLTIKSIMQSLRKNEADSTSIYADFIISYSTFLGKVNVPFQKTVMIKTPMPPDFEFYGLERENISLLNKNADFVLNAALINHYQTFGLELRNLEYRGKIGERLSGKGHYDPLISLNPAAKQELHLPFRLEYNQVFKILRKIISNNDQMDYEIEIKGDLRTLQNDTSAKVSDWIPFEVTASGRLELVNREK